MLDSARLLFPTRFPPVRRRRNEVLQVNLGYRCNQSCRHCHVNAGPKRSESMGRETVEQVLDFLRAHADTVRTLDLTGGAPELNPHFRYLVSEAYALGIRVIDRCNLTILEEPGQEGLAQFLTDHQVEVVASLPCYLQQNVDGQRGRGVFETSVGGLRRLNVLGYGWPQSKLVLNLVYNPIGPTLPPSQSVLEAEYRQQLEERFDIHFNRLFVLTNMPIGRFGSQLQSRGEFAGYMDLLRRAFEPGNLEQLMCRSQISVDWRGYLYDCDFNQLLDLPISIDGKRPCHISELGMLQLDNRAVRVGEHCYGCTAGQGSSCGGALASG